MSSPMIEALRKRKGRGLDISILLDDVAVPEDANDGVTEDSDNDDFEDQDSATQEDETNQKDLGLAPDGTAVGVKTDRENLADSQKAKPMQMKPGAEDYEDDTAPTDKEMDGDMFHRGMEDSVGTGGMGPLQKAAMAKFIQKKKGFLK